MKNRPAILSLLLLAAFGAGAEPWTLQRALEYARDHNPDARIAEWRIRGAQAGLEEANAAFWPRLQLQSGYSRTDNPMMVFGNILNQRAYSTSLDFNHVPDVDDLNVRGTMEVPLYAGGSSAAGRDAARSRKARAERTREAIRDALAFEVVRAFQTLLKTREFIRASEAAVNAFNKNLEVAKSRLEGGTLLKSDLLSIEVHLARAQEDLVVARKADKLANRALRNLLGMEEGELSIVEEVPAAEAPDSLDFSRRAELAAARERESEARSRLRSERGGYQPRVSAFGSLDYDYGWVTGGDGQSYTAGILLRWDLWDGFSTRARVRQAAAELESVRAEEQKLRLDLALEADRARLELQAATERLAVSGKVVASATENARLVRERFEQGLALSIQLIDAETALVGARVRRVDALSDQRIAVAAVRKALGLPQLDPKQGDK
jgi:outer membrane protein